MTMNRKALIGSIFCLVAIILIVISMFMPWYQIRNTRYDNGVEYRIDSRFESTTVTEIDGEHSTTETGYFEEFTGFNSAMENSRFTLILGLLMMIFSLISIVLYVKEKLEKKYVATILTLSIVLVLISPVYLAFQLPGAIEEDMKEGNYISGISEDKMGDSFSGTVSNEENGETRWGGGVGWLIAFIAFGTSVCSLLAVLSMDPIIHTAPVGNSRPKRPVKKALSEEKPVEDERKTIINEDDGMINY